MSHFPALHVDNAGTYHKELKKAFCEPLIIQIKPEQCLRQSGWGKVRHKTADTDIERTSDSGMDPPKQIGG